MTDAINNLIECISINIAYTKANRLVLLTYIVYRMIVQ